MKSLAPRATTRHWAIRLIVASVLCGVTACIIGPKQDDPETAGVDVTDTGVVDTGSEFTADTRTPEDVSTVPHDETGALTDGAPSSDTGIAKVDGGACDGGDAADAGCDGGGADAVGGD